MGGGELNAGPLRKKTFFEAQKNPFVGGGGYGLSARTTKNKRFLLLPKRGPFFFKYTKFISFNYTKCTLYSTLYIYTITQLIHQI